MMFAAPILTASLAALQAAAAPAPPTCDLVQETPVEWAAIGATVTLRVEIFDSEYATAPDGRQTLVLADGREILLGEGGKYIDDWDPAAPPACTDHAEAAGGAIIDSLEGAVVSDAEPASMAMVEAEMRRDVDCDAPDIWLEPLTCEARAIIREAFEGDRAAYDRLVAADAPILAVPYSTYGVEFVAVDLATGQAYPLHFSGC